jgi:hypothetical protein
VAFCGEFLGLLSHTLTPLVQQETSDLVTFLAELSVVDYWFVTKRPSSVALAAILNALALPGPDKMERERAIEVLNRFADAGLDISKDHDIGECRARLHAISTGEAGPRVVGSPQGVAGLYDPDEYASAPPSEYVQRKEADEAEASPTLTVHFTSPGVVAAHGPSRSCKRKTRSFTRSMRVKKTRKNLSRELDEVERA